MPETELKTEFYDLNNLSYFPLPYNSKKPFKESSWNPYKKQSFSLPNKNIAVKCGINNLGVSDIDKKEIGRAHV